MALYESTQAMIGNFEFANFLMKCFPQTPQVIFCASGLCSFTTELAVSYCSARRFSSSCTLSKVALSMIASWELSCKVNTLHPPERII